MSKTIEPIPLQERVAKGLSYEFDLRRYGSQRYAACQVRFWSDGLQVEVKNVEGVPFRSFVRYYPALERSISHLKEESGLFEE